MPPDIFPAGVAVRLHCWHGDSMVSAGRRGGVTVGAARQNSGCQATCFALLVEAEVAVAEEAAWLPKNRGSRQATLAAKNEWIQWRTANKFENSSSWKEKRSK